MRKFSLGLAACLAIALGASAQVGFEFELQLDQDQFLPGEAVPIAARITNRSGRALEMGENPDWLTFSLESKEVSGKVVPKIEEVPVQGAFTLPASKRAIKRVDLAPYFAILSPGKYSVTATLHIQGWRSDITCAPVHFYVIDGPRIWEREVGVPASGTNGTPEVRRYALQQANHLRGTPKLYLRVTDGAGSLLKLHMIGTILSFSRPDPQVDSESNLHLLYQNGPSTFGYTVFTPHAELIKRQTWDYLGESRPRLRPDEAGKIVIVGGVRRETRDDFPPPIENGSDSSPDAAPAQTPPKTAAK